MVTMVNWIFLLVALPLCCFSQDEDRCYEAESTWTVDKLEQCVGDIIDIKQGTYFNLSGWSDDDLGRIFNTKTLDGGFIIQESQEITGKDIIFNVFLKTAKTKVEFIVVDNPKLEEFFIEITPRSPPPYLLVAGNRNLGRDSVQLLNDLLENKMIRTDSHIQAYQECNLNGTTIKDVMSELKNCTAIYGDLIFDSNTAFPQDDDWKNVEPLEYVEGCLRIIGTNLTSWDAITFLKETITLKGCKKEHEISGNKNMCIQPPLAHKLKEDFNGLIIADNQQCTPECTNSYLQDTKDTACVIITDSLVINDRTTKDELEAMANVQEIRGNFQMINTTITDFNYLPNLKKLNTDKYDSGAVINLQYNKQLKSFDLPQLDSTGLFVGKVGQLKYQYDNKGEYKTDPEFLKRIGANLNETIVEQIVTTTEGTTTTPVPIVPTVKPIPAKDIFKMHGANMAIAGASSVVGCLLFGLIFIGKKVKLWQWPKNWQWHPITGEVDQKDIYKYEKETEFHKEAKKLIENSKPKIEANNLKHKNNTTYKKLTFYNHMARKIMPGIFQENDYLANTGRKEFEDDLLDYPANENGVYGLAFQKKVGYPAVIRYRTQCDLYGSKWFLHKLPPIYPEYFETTANLMSKIPCDMIGERIEYMKNNDIAIGEFGITGQGFHAVVTVDNDDPVPSRAKREQKDVFWLGDQIPEFKIHRYREKLNNLKIKGKKFTWLGGKNLDKFVCRLADALMNLPTKENLELTVADIEHFLKIIQPSLFGEAAHKKKYPRARMSVGEYSALMKKTHVRIVGEIRGDFDALRRAINIPSLLDGKEHPLLQYNWVFLGNYTGRHPQSLETLMFLLALQFLYGRDCIILLRGVMEFENTSQKYGFKENLTTRFGAKDGPKVWEMMMTVISKLPFNCQVLYGAYCSSGGFTEADVEEKAEEEESNEPERTAKRNTAGKEKNVSSATSNMSNMSVVEVNGTDASAESLNATSGTYHKLTTPRELDKLFSQPNVTVKDYLENADTGAGYYYGERVLQKIAKETHMYTFFSTTPMTGGVGFFSESSAAQLITISSVRHLHGHGGQKTLLAAVAEINGDTDLLTMHMILHEDEMFYYDQKTGELRDVNGKKKGKKGASSISSQVSQGGADATSLSSTGSNVERTPKNTEDKETASKIEKDSKAKKAVV